MNKPEALRLKPGAHILYGEHRRIVDCVRGSGFHVGRVIHVTPNGGIKVEMLHPNGITSYGREAWVPYHHSSVFLLSGSASPARGPPKLNSARLQSV
jgi:hypothetical protein